MVDRAFIEQFDHAIDEMLAGTSQALSEDPTLFALMEIARRLRDFPNDEFKTRLSRELLAGFQRRPMTSSTSIESTASEFAAIHTVTPFVCVPEGDKLIEFMKHTFAAEETSRQPHGS